MQLPRKGFLAFTFGCAASFGGWLLFITACTATLFPQSAIAQSSEWSCDIDKSIKDISSAVAECKGRVLFVHLNQNRKVGGRGWISFRNKDKCLEEATGIQCRHFALVRFDARINLVIVEVTFGEGEDYLVIDRSTGSISTFDVEPEFSPSGRYALELVDDMGYDNGPLVKLSTKGKYGFSSTWSASPNAENMTTYKLLSWEREECVALSSETLSNGDLTPRVRTFVVKRVGGTWQLLNGRSVIGNKRVRR